MVVLASAAAIALYLVPVAVLLWHRRHRPPLDLALCIPVAVAIDILTLLLLTLVLRLETAVLLSRPLWLIAAVTWPWAHRRLRAPGLPPQLQPPPPATSAPPSPWRAHLPAAASALGLALLSVLLSRPYAIWDRLWHEPLVASLRGQRLPFTNVFEPGRVLHYHVAGDVLGVALQVLSANTIHAAHALSLAHDLMFALMGATLSLLLRGCGRGPLACLLLPGAVALAGPFTLIPLDDRYRFWGYSLHNYLTLSYRPHTAIFGLLAAGVCAALLDRDRRHLAALLALFALLGITDEVSAALLLLAVAAAWLADPARARGRPDTGHPAADARGARRWLALPLALVLPLCLLAAAILLPNLVFRASLSPGGPASALQLVPPRAPGFGHAPLPLTTARGAFSLLLDLAPTLLFLAPLLIPRPPRPRATLLALTLLLAGVAGLTAVEINHTPVESHRFMTAALVVIPLLACATATGPIARFLLAGGAALASVSTFAWVFLAMPTYGRNYRNVNHAIDCRSTTGAHLGERPVPTYVSPALFATYAGCRPIYTAGVPPAQQWGISLGPALGPAALPALFALPPRAASLPIVCSRGHDPDAVCTITRARCQPAGRAVDICLRER